MEIYSVYDTASFEEVLDDLCVRFVVNLPEEELASRERVCFQIEEAHWFYEDFVREQNLSFPSLNLRTFLAKIFQHCPPLQKWGMHEDAYADFMLYKKRVPIRGAILLNEAMTHCILVKGWKQSSSWSFPRGKINKDEPDDKCAIREVMEETGFDIKDLIEPSQFLVHENLGNNHMKLYIVPGVPEDTSFMPQSRKEISRVEWQALSELPSFSKRKSQNTSGINTGKLFMVVPFMPELRKWIIKRKKQRARKLHGNTRSRAVVEETEPETSAVETSPTRPTASSFLPDDTRNSELLRNMLGIGGDQSHSMPIVTSIPPPSQVSAASPHAAGANLLALLKGGASHENPQGIWSEDVATPLAGPQLSGRQISLTELFSSVPKRSPAMQTITSPHLPTSVSSVSNNPLPPGYNSPSIGYAPQPAIPGVSRTAMSSPHIGATRQTTILQISQPVQDSYMYPPSAGSTLPTKLSNQSSALLQMLKSSSPSPAAPSSAASTLHVKSDKPKPSLLDSLIPTAPARPPDSAHAVSLLEILRGAAPPPPSEPDVKALPLQSDAGLLSLPARGPVIANGSGRATPVQPLSSPDKHQNVVVPTPLDEKGTHTASLLATLRGGVVQSSPRIASPALGSASPAQTYPNPQTPPIPISEVQGLSIQGATEVLAPVDIPENGTEPLAGQSRDTAGTFDRRKIVDNKQAQKLLDLFKTTPSVTEPAVSQPMAAKMTENDPKTQELSSSKPAPISAPSANSFLLGYLDEVAKKYGK